MKELPFSDSDINTLFAGNKFNLKKPLSWKTSSLFLLLLFIILGLLFAEFMKKSEPHFLSFWGYFIYIECICTGSLIFSLPKMIAKDQDYKEKIKVQFTAKVKKVKDPVMSYYYITLYENPYSEDKLAVYGDIIKTPIKENEEYVFEVAKRSGTILSATPVENSALKK
ncbi:MAG TPA: hypothetical protein VNG53_03110 [Bacteroidia bacterium]|nr:hypothetical protein [Bacteroidia bacterium]